jgi:hypothetical protein
MIKVEFLIAAAIVVGLGLLILVSRLGGHDDPDIESGSWRRVDAEVISVLRASNRTFLRVRFSVGTSLIHSDVQYPLADAVPHTGQRVPIRYDPVAPARLVFDLCPSVPTPLI